MIWPRARKRHLLIISLFTILLLCWQINQGATEDNLIGDEISKLMRNGGSLLAADQGILFQHNPSTLFSPASILKIATSLSALTILGPDYRFTTDFYLDLHHNLYIKGYGDPFLTSEEIARIIRELKYRGITVINNIILYSSAFDLTDGKKPNGNSLNPYDATNNALCANFNTVFLEKSINGTIRSAEAQTPTLPMMIKTGQNLEPGRHRVNISTDKKDITRHFGELFRSLHNQAGIKGNGDISHGTMPPGAKPTYRHYSSKTIHETIGPFLLYSNNFIANQIYLACGIKQHGLPATWEKARETMTDYLLDIGLHQETFILEEGSGLARQNKITPRAMLTILKHFKPYACLLPSADGALIKSGTMENVYSYAGYFKHNHELRPFVIILNQPENNRDHILKKLKMINKRGAISPNN